MMFWKSKWKKQIDNVLPSLNIEQQTQGVQEKRSASRVPWYKQKRLSFIASGLVAVMVFTCLLTTLLVTPPYSEKEKTAIALEINPSVVFILDDKGNVEQAKALNEDADFILANNDYETKIKGKPAKQALNSYLELALKMGYIDYKGDAVRLSTNKWSKSTDEIKGSMQNFLVENNAKCAVFENKLSDQNFAELLGLDDSKDLIDNVTSLPKLFGWREVENLSQDDLTDRYKEQVFDQVVDRLLTQIENNGDFTPEEIFQIKQLLIWFSSLQESALFELFEILDKIDPQMKEGLVDVLKKAPETKDEYIQVFQSGKLYIGNIMIQDNKAIYDSVKEEVTIEDVQEYFKELQNKGDIWK